MQIELDERAVEVLTELQEQAKELGAVPDVVLAGASGGGLVTGVSIAVKALNPATEVFCVEPEAIAHHRVGKITHE